MLYGRNRCNTCNSIGNSLRNTHCYTAIRGHRRNRLCDRVGNSLRNTLCNTVIRGHRRNRLCNSVGNTRRFIAIHRDRVAVPLNVTDGLLLSLIHI